MSIPLQSEESRGKRRASGKVEAHAESAGISVSEAEMEGAIAPSVPIELAESSGGSRHEHDGNGEPAAEVALDTSDADKGGTQPDARVADSQPEADSRSAASLPTTPPNTTDPIAEAPHAVWYVRPPTGGQFGPASADVMRRWITEGRVTEDSWVWRDGWSDWQPASDMFREPTNTTTSAPAERPTPPADVPAIVLDDNLSGIRTEGRSARPHKSMTKTLALVAALGVVSIVLLGGLIHVILSANG